VANRFSRAGKHRKRIEAKATAQHNFRIEGYDLPSDVPLEPDARISPPVIDGALTWFAITVRPGTQRRVMSTLKRGGITVYCPVETLWRQRARSVVREQIQRPLFGSVVFIGTDADTSWMTVYFNDDVSGVLSNDGKPLPIPVADLRTLADRERGGAFETGKGGATKAEPEAAPAPATPAGIQVGDVAKFEDGFFVGEEVDVVGIQAEEARVVLKHFRTATVMRVPMSLLRPVAQAEIEHA
jgi:transcription antitermination factor NusG